MSRDLTLSLSPSNASEEIVVEWRRPAGGNAITHYYLQWRRPYTGKFTNHISGQVNYSCTIANLNPATTYDVRILALNFAGWGRVTAFKTITTGTKSLSVALL